MTRQQPPCSRLLLALTLSCVPWLTGCDSEEQVVQFQVRTVQWAAPSATASDVRVVLEEQRLNNGVLNAFYTEIEEATTDESGLVELQTVRSNVLSIRIRAEKEGCFTEIVELNPESLTSGDTPNDVEVVVMPQCFVQAEIDNTASPCPGSSATYKWTPRNLDGAVSEVRWTCDTDWQGIDDGEVIYEGCLISGGTWLLHRRYWACADSTLIDSVWCPEGGTVELVLD